MIPIIQTYGHEILKWIFIGLCLWKIQDIKEFIYSMLGDGGKVSSRRTSAFLCVATLCYMAIYGLHKTQPVDHWILGLLGIFAVLCLGLATLPQIMELVKNVKNIIPDTKQTITNEQVQTTNTSDTTTITNS